ncbi:MAG: diguanylate cyclase [Omnitrophica bacterium RIFCSPHIGHO2_02_FULL_63_14]|nr:MAG: diguanylate cyclase [Omnitrophica bacterium RIFCSPHIGHO2_02_FULL_63_14]
MPRFILLLLGITFLSFALIHMAPGGPADALRAQDPRMSAESARRIEALYGLDDPLLVQYGRWLKRVAVLDFGRSYRDGEPVAAKIARAVPVTLSLNLLSLFFIFAIGIPLGVSQAAREGSRWDRWTGSLTMAGFSVPTFWLALLLMNLLGVHLRWLPVSGLVSLDFESYSWWQKLWDLKRHLILPVLIASVTGLAGISRFMRSSMAGVLTENYIRAARARGLSERRVIYGHALRNALLPVVTILGLSVPGLLGGSVIFESIFSLPGMGRLFYESVFSRDYPVILAVLFIGSVLTLLGNRLADGAYRLADPRVRHGR